MRESLRVVDLKERGEKRDVIESDNVVEQFY